MPDKGKGRAENTQLSTNSHGTSATGSDRSPAGQESSSTNEEQNQGGEEAQTTSREGRSTDEANNDLTLLHRSSAALPPASPTGHPRPHPISSSSSSSDCNTIPPMHSLSDNLTPLLRCPLCRPPRLLQLPYVKKEISSATTNQDQFRMRRTHESHPEAEQRRVRGRRYNSIVDPLCDPRYLSKLLEEIVADLNELCVRPLDWHRDGTCWCP